MRVDRRQLKLLVSSAVTAIQCVPLRAHPGATLTTTLYLFGSLVDDVASFGASHVWGSGVNLAFVQITIARQFGFKLIQVLCVDLLVRVNVILKL